ncbi:MAG: DeoR family transcriptional regulator [Rhodobacterales bacterium]|nr:DeoR family transcriptional regulator [Rhodobacterales bacterium]
MSNQHERRDRILDLVRAQGFASIDSLAQRFAVTPQTIRRDINALSAEALVRRYHGGAGLPSNVENTAYANRQVMNRAAKKAIADMVVRHIPDQASLFINIGTTTEAVAAALTDRRDLRIITNNLNVAVMLAAREDFQILVTGCQVRPRDRGIIGEAALDFVQQFRVEYAIIGISGIDRDGTLLDFDYREVRVAKAIIANARSVYLCADHSKFGRAAMVGLGDIGQVTALFTDLPPPEPLRAALADKGVDLYVASEQGKG